jgi:hypothetical protein
VLRAIGEFVRARKFIVDESDGPINIKLIEGNPPPAFE